MSKVRKAKRARYRITHIRDWRAYRHLTLKDVENRMLDNKGDPMITSVSIGRIERGLQPYTQPVLEGLAVALDCTAWELLEVDPRKQGEVVDLMRILQKLDQSRVGQIAKVAKALAS